jgi:hypothetical protein
MSDSNIHSYITFGWVATIIGLLLFGALGNSYVSAGYQSAYYAVKCGQQNPESPFASEYSVAHQAKLIEKFEASQSLKGRDWCDLAAQQSMAEDTKWMLWIAVIGANTSMLGTAFLAWTIMQNRQAIAIANKSIEVGRAQTRSYLTVKSARFKTFPHDCWFVFEIENNGLSQARDVELSVFISSQFSLNGGFEFPGQMRGKSFANLHYGSISASTIMPHEFQFHQDEAQTKSEEVLFERIRDHHWFVIDLRINWKDVFGNSDSDSFKLKSDHPIQTVHEDDFTYGSGTMSLSKIPNS